MVMVEKKEVDVSALAEIMDLTDDICRLRILENMCSCISENPEKHCKFLRDELERKFKERAKLIYNL